MNEKLIDEVGRAVLLALELRRHPAMPGNVIVQICEPNVGCVSIVLEKIDLNTGRSMGSIAAFRVDEAAEACEEIKASLDAVKKADDEKRAADGRLQQAKSKLGLL